MQNWVNIRNAFTALLLALLLVLGYGFSHYKKEAQQAGQLAQDLNKELRQTVNELGQTTSTVTVLQADKAQLLNLAAGKDTLLLKLQAELRQAKKPQAVTVFTAKTSGQASGKTISVLPVATADTVLVYPEYAGTISQPDIQAQVRANKDSVFLDSYTIYTSFTYLEHLERKGLFKRELVVSIKPDNPNTVVTGAKAWRKEQPSKGAVFLKGTAVGAALVILVKILAT